MKKTAWIGVAAVLGLGLSGRWLIWGKAEAAGPGAGPASSTRCRVERGPLRIVVEENGYLAAKDNVKISPKFKGQGTIAVLVEEGKSVVVGDVLVEFDKTQLEQQISELENSLLQYEIELDAAKANLEIQERDNQASIEKAELTLEFAQLTLERYEQGDAPNELRKLELAAEKATSQLERAKERFQQVPELVTQGFLTRIQEEEERILLREAEINDENARKELELHHAYTTRMERTKKESDVKDAVRELENARKKADIHLKEKQAALAQRDRQVTSTKNRLEQQRTELGHYTIKAENPGIVHYGDPENPWWRQEVKVGNSAYQGQTLVTIPDLSSMQVLLQIHEDDIDKIKLDLPVIVTVDARKGESFTGKITEIASVATSNNWSDESNKAFKVEVTLDPFSGELRAGITAKAEVAIETLSDVLFVPIHAIVPEGGKHLAFLIQGARTEEREVKIGRNNAHSVQVLEGLAEGDELLLYDPRAEGEASRAAPGKKPEHATEAPLPGAPPAE
ncbi:MAG: HlyD family efflux transporter periplasmic adaptor subunit [Planctomycetes bacterium]|nr:HlyD family efflux transporter periplasmic adaptor subunit [Planctomycetota bacterium]